MKGSWTKMKILFILTIATFLCSCQSEFKETILTQSLSIEEKRHEYFNNGSASSDKTFWIDKLANLKKEVAGLDCKDDSWRQCLDFKFRLYDSIDRTIDFIKRKGIENSFGEQYSLVVAEKDIIDRRMQILQIIKDEMENL